MSTHFEPTVIVLAGPTATGKTALALALADRLPVALISVDSAMVYRGMDIGTAKPSPALLARYPHALIDIRDPADPYSAADFVRDADAAVRQALARGRVPVLVGGTMLYVRAFRHGLADLPAADPVIRAALAAEAERAGWPHLHATLREVDPEAARRVHPHNHVRIQRALEVYRVTGRPISHWWAEQAQGGAAARLGVRLLETALVPTDLAALEGPMAVRFDAMLANGFVEEVARLRERGDLSRKLPSMRAVGYRQIWSYLDGTLGQAEMREAALAATRTLAKRQLTWLRRWDHVEALAPGRPEANARRLEERLEAR